MRPLLAILLALMFWPQVLLSQSSSSHAETPPPSDPVTSAETLDIVRRALLREKAADAQKTRYTRLDLEHNIEEDGKGKPIRDSTELFEDTWINDLPYEHLLQQNGLPLTGKALAREEAFYQEQLKNHKALDVPVRSHNHYFRLSFRYDDILSTAYQIRPQYATTCLEQPCHVFLAEPVALDSPNTPEQPSRYLLWIMDKDPFVARVTCTLLRDLGREKQGTHALLDFGLVDGIPFLMHRHLVWVTKSLGMSFLTDVEDTYSKYRRFSTTVTIHSEGQVIPASPDRDRAPTKPPQ